MRPFWKQIVVAAGVAAMFVVQNDRAEPAGAVGIRTDRRVYAEPPPPRLPKAGGTFTDPVFGTTLMRVTDERDGADCHNAYSYWPTFNSNNRRFHILCGGGPMLYAFDPASFKLLGREPLFAGRAPGGGSLQWEDCAWSGVNPDVIFAHEGLNLWAYDVAARKCTLVKNFARDLSAVGKGGLVLNQMSKSLDDRVFAFAVKTGQPGAVGCFAWRADRDKIVFSRKAGPGFDEAQLDKTGKYLLIKDNAPPVEACVAHLDTQAVEGLTDGPPDLAPSHSDNGRGTVVGGENWRNSILIRRLSDPHRFQTVLAMGDDWSQDYHVSLLADDERWALVSLYVDGNHKSSGVFRNEILLAAADGSGRVLRLCHHHSVFKDYWDSPRANISRDGRFVAFTSNWGGSGRRDVFILKVPQLKE